MKIKHLSIKTRLKTSFFISIIVFVALIIYNQLKSRSLNFPVYITITLVIGILDFFIYKYKD
ncbi:hypothetical protein GCM10023330_12540 [Litoribaculum gwangyangense]|uniref:Uncharacterized protein n=1 Tax=Litoribaculum gwangyangense TaxID=1130722 RepID=A0ABP9CBU3_9FLAO